MKGVFNDVHFDFNDWDTFVASSATKLTSDPVASNTRLETQTREVIDVSSLPVENTSEALVIA